MRVLLAPEVALHYTLRDLGQKISPFVELHVVLEVVVVAAAVAMLLFAQYVVRRLQRKFSIHNS